MPLCKQEPASDAARASDHEAEVMSHLPASFRVLATFAMKKGKGGINE